MMKNPEQNQPAFSIINGINEIENNALIQLCTEETYRAGELICKAGQESNALYYIIQGTVRIVNDKNIQQQLLIDTLHPNTVFGKDFLHTFIPQKFSYYANDAKTVLLRLGIEELNEFFRSNPKTENKIRIGISSESLSDFVNNNKFKATIPLEKINEIINDATILDLKSGDFLFHEKEPHENIYYLYKGVLKSEKISKRSAPVQFSYGGSIFGELMKGIGEPLSSGIIAETAARVIVIPKIDLMLALYEQKGFTSSFDEIIEKTLVQSPKAAPKAEDKKPEIDQPESEEYKFHKPLKYYFGLYPKIRQQSAMDCGATCVAMICRYYGKRVNLNRMRELTRVGRQGASMFYLMTALQELGFEVNPMLSTYDDLKESNLPAIVNWKGYHWIVINKMTDKKVWVSDPAGGRIVYKKEDFIESWTRYALYIKPTKAINNIQEEKPTLKNFKTYFIPYKKYIYEIAIASLCIQVLNVFQPVFSKFIIDNVIVKQDKDILTIALIIISVITLFSTVLNFVRQKLVLFVSMKVNVSLLSDFLKHILNLPLRFFEDRKVGDITTRFLENEKITAFMTSTGIQVFLDVITAVLYLGLMYYYNAHLTFVVCFFVAVQILIFKLITPRLLHAYREVFFHNAASESFLIESLKGISTVKTLGIENLTRWKWENLQIKFINSFFKTIKYGISSSLMANLVTNLSDVSVLFYGSMLALNNQLTIGELVAFTLMTKSVSAPIMSVMSSWNVFQEAINSVERLNDVLETPPEIPAKDKEEKIVLPEIRGYMKFDDVTFRYYDDSKDNVIANITFEVKPGQRIALVGRSGSGKSTLTKLLYGFYKPSSGKIFVDGFDLSDLYLPELRRQIGMVPQENDLFRGTIRENISKGLPNAQLSDIIDAAKLANAHEFISGFPKGYDTFLEERGSNLSGGQRQRIAIARTFMMKPRILILDEATSALDNETEKNIQYNIENNFHNCTIIMIAHRLSTVRKADLILVIDHGNIIEAGSHDDLVKNRGLYYYLSTQQLSL
jgi:ATP-binding cassette subfamily B protein